METRYRTRSKSDTPMRDDSFSTSHYMTHMQDLEHNMDVPSDINIQGAEYRPRASSNTTTRGRPPSSHQKIVQATRHARRLYFGGFSVSTEEDKLKDFLNDIISTGLGEANDNSYILSIYLNQKKCFAFVELKSIELTSACLSLDGVLMGGLSLKVQRANEYKPDMVPPVKTVIQLDLSKIPFHDGVTNLSRGASENSTDSYSYDRMSIPYVDISMLKLGDIVLVGVSNGAEEEATHARRIIKNYLQVVRGSNPEYGVDISDINVVDAGDVQLNYDEIDTDSGRRAVQNMVARIVSAGGYPVLLGIPPGFKNKLGDSPYADDNCLLASICGVISALDANEAITQSPPPLKSQNEKSEPNVAVLSVSSKIRRICPLLLSDFRFCGSNHNGIESCDGRLRAFGLQGSQCTMDTTRHLLSRGALLTWLTRDIRVAEKRQTRSSLLLPFDKVNSNNTAVSIYTEAGKQFQEALHKLCMNRDAHLNSGMLSSPDTMKNGRSVIVSFHPDASVLGGANSQHCPLGQRCAVCGNVGAQGGEGLSPAEWLDMAVATGLQKNVAALDLSGWNGITGCHRLPTMLLGNVFYHFLLGVALSRVHHVDESPSKYFTSSSVMGNSRSIFETFKFDDSDGRKTDDGDFAFDDGPRRTSLSDATVPYGMSSERKFRMINASNIDVERETPSRPYTSLGIAIPSDNSVSDGVVGTSSHGLFVDTPGSFIARGALSILESPMGSCSADVTDIVCETNSSEVDPPDMAAFAKE